MGLTKSTQVGVTMTLVFAIKSKYYRNFCVLFSKKLKSRVYNMIFEVCFVLHLNNLSAGKGFIITLPISQF